MRLPIALTPVLLLALAAPAAAGPPPAQSLTYQSLTIARVNPLGLFELAEIGYRARLYDSNNPLFENNFVQLGARVILTPGLARAAAMLRVQPLSVFQFWAEYEVGGFFGNFSMLQSFESADAEASDTVLEQREEAGLNYATTNSQLALGSLLQAKVGPIAVRSLARFIRPNVDIEEGDTAYYDIAYDVVIPNRTWALNKDTDLLFVTDFGLAAGVRWTFTHVFSDAADFAPPREDNPNVPMHRLGPIVAYTFWDEPGTAFNAPTAILIANWWLQHRYRTGQDVTQALPYIVLGFRFSGDLWVGE